MVCQRGGSHRAGQNAQPGAFDVKQLGAALTVPRSADELFQKFGLVLVVLGLGDQAFCQQRGQLLIVFYDQQSHGLSKTSN